MAFMNSSYRGRKNEGTCGMPDYAKVNAWDVGVRVEPDLSARQDTLRVYLTGGSHDTHGKTLVGLAWNSDTGPKWEPADPPKPPRIPVNVKTAGHPLERYAMPVIAALPVASHTNNPEPDEYICVVLTGRWPSGEPVFGTVRATREGDDWVTESRAYDMGVLGTSPGPWSLVRATTEMVEMTGYSRPACTKPHGTH
jgi:hypothetical protein